jgi:hypothetical protein
MEFVWNFDAADFKFKVFNLKEDTDEALKARWAEFGVNLKDNNGFVAMDKAEAYGHKYPQFSRDTGANILKLIEEGEIDTVRLSTDFAAESLFCEWAYVLDLDKGVVEIYKGFNTKPLPENDRFKFLEEKRDNEYYPVKCVWTNSFEGIKLMSMEDIKEEMKKLERLVDEE